MDLVEKIEKIIASTGLSKNKVNLEDVKRDYVAGHFKRGYELKVKYTSSDEIKEIVFKVPSFEYIIYSHNTQK